ncbi:MAG: HIT family protein [Verrucomicrobiales bacterium]|jgi:diadenosine tetraphosphate (Ap4A) HIT family hydrolase|nr:HIT family protein [Verrucomicrobiales bacterium]
MTSDCPFCELTDRDLLAENEHASAFRDQFPVSKLHTLIIPKRHVEDYFSLNEHERNDIHDLLETQSKLIKEGDPEVEGFNIGWNCGEVAGQTIFHAHVHLIPRRKGDVENPRGGVRYIFPDKGNY